MAPPLHAFFAAAARLHRGELSPASFAAALGGAPSAGLEAQARLAARAPRALLGDLYPAVRRAAGPGWEALAAAYLAAHPPRHWDVNRLGEALPEFAAGLLARGAPLPPYLAELAALQRADLRAQLAPDAFDPARDRLNPTLAVLHLAHDVLAYALDPAAASVRPGPLTLLVLREPRSHAVHFHRPTPVELLALGLASGELGPEAASELAPAALAAAEDALVALGALGRG